MKQKHVMLGRTQPVKSKRRHKTDKLIDAAKAFNQAFDVWAQGRGRTHLVYGYQKFAHK